MTHRSHSSGLTLAALITLLLAPLVLFGFVWDLGVVPWTPPSRDILFAAMALRSLANGGLVPFGALNNAEIGAPFGLQGADWPLDSPLQLLIMWPLALVLKNPFLVMNLYLVITHVMSAAAFYLLAINVKVRKETAIAASLVFAFIPFHLLRTRHMSLTAHAAVAIAVLLCVWIFQGKPVFAKERRWLVLAAALAIGFWQGYFAFFSCLFLVASGIAASAISKDARPMLRALGLCAITTAAGVVCMIPTLLYKQKNGPNPAVAQRQAQEVDLYALRPLSILLPPPSHRVPPLAAIGAAYESAQGTSVEGHHIEYLGAFAIFGLVAMLLAARRTSLKARGIEWFLLLLTIVAVLYAIPGGGGSIFARAVTPIFRSLNRISVFIACFGVLGAAVWLDKRFAKLGGRRLIGVLCAIVLLAFVDQLPELPTQAPRDEYVEATQQIYRKVQAALPNGTTVLQLPYMQFPEGALVGDLFDYQHFEAYLNTHDLRFSYGAMKGRAAAQQIEQLSLMPIDVAAVKALYGAVLVDKRGYSDEGAAVHTHLTSQGLERKLDTEVIALYTFQ